MENMKNLGGVEKIKNSEITVGYMEEWLLNEMPEIQVDSGVGTLVVGLDCGSTQTRGVIHEVDVTEAGQDIQEIFVLPSGYGVVEFGKDILPNSPLMYDRLNSMILNLDEDVAEMLETANVVRTSQASNLGIKETFLASKKDKSTDPSMIINILDTLGYGLISKTGGVLKDRYEVNATIALPPEELTERNITRLKENLRSYSWGTEGKAVTFEFTHLEFIPEAEAYIQASYAFSDEVPTYSLHLEGGGRSISPALCKEGRPIYTARVSFPYGGSQLKANIARRFYEIEGIEPSTTQVEEALRTGSIKVGTKLFDIVDIIKEEKDKFGAKIANDIVREVFDRVEDITPTMIENISASGRLFSGGEIEVSIFDYLVEELKEVAQYAEYDLLDDQLVCIGAILYEFNKLQ